LITQYKYTNKPADIPQKKESLKNYSLIVSRKLRSIDLKKQFGVNYISANGHTIFDYQDLVKKLSKCGNEETYLNSDYIENGIVKEGIKKVNSCACNIFTLCPTCASKRRSELIREVKPYLKIAEKMPVHLYMGTITISDSNDPAADYDKLRKSWTRFIKMGQLRNRKSGKRSKGEASKIIGSILSIEIVPVIGSDRYHVHGHNLMVCNAPLDYTIYNQDKKKELEKIYGKGEIPQNLIDSIITKKISIPDAIDCGLIDKEIAVSKLSEQWHKASGAINFWVTPLRERVIKGKLKTIDNQLYEIIKYTTKIWELDPVEILKLWDTIHNKKRLTKSGIFTQSITYKNIWIDLLRENNLIDEFKTMCKQDRIEIGFSVNEVTRQVFNYDTYCYDYILEECDYSYLNSPEYENYLSLRAKIINKYRVSSNQMIRDIQKSRMISEPDPDIREKWISDKENLKINMRNKIRDLIREFTETTL
jgi:hypothetical protein